MKKISILIILILLVFTGGCKSESTNTKTQIPKTKEEITNDQLSRINKEDKKNERPDFSTGIVRIETKKGQKFDINAEMAMTEEEKAYGLMFVTELKENDGMWFVSSNEEIQNFWMKNTLIPLDIIFVNKDYKIVNIERADPCKKENCDIYSSKVPAKYVLELNLGSTRKNNIEVGDTVYAIMGEE